MSFLSRLIVNVPLYYLFLTFVATESVISEQCDSGQQKTASLQKLSEELNKTEGFGSVAGHVGTSACDSKTSTYLEDEALDNIRIETGLEFIRGNAFLKFDEDLYFGSDEYSTFRRSQFTLMELVRSFIREVKGVRALPLGSDPLSGANDGSDKLAWCFYPYKLKNLAQVEISMYHILKDFYYKVLKKEKPGHLPVLDSYLRDIEESSLRAITNVEYANNKRNDSFEDPYLYISTHPLLMYRMIRRFVEDLHHILLVLEEYEDLIEALYYEANPQLLVFPTTQDLKDALDSILRIQDGTSLNTLEFARGKMDMLQTDIYVSALHALEIGAHYITETNYAFAVEWLYYALDTISVSQSPVVEKYPIIKKFFRKTFNHAIELHNENWETVSKNYWNLNVFHTKITPPYHPKFYVRIKELMKDEAARSRDNFVWNWAINVNFMHVCAGKNLQTEKEKLGLSCWYQRKHNPYWVINPLKLELLNRDPPLYQIYDFIGDKLIAQIKEAAVSGLQRSTVVDRTDATKSIVEQTRTSSQTWIYDNNQNGKFLLPLSYRMQLMSKLTLVPPESCDAYQVANYGPSHHYAPHIDSFEDPRRSVDKGNRILTIMGYLSHVKAGGRTGFPVLGVAAEPVKGSIVMWYNLKKNGEERDMRTWHGGCPVVFGVKWITNKWVYYKENFRDFPCGLNPEE